MESPDVNVLVYAYDEAAPQHRVCRAWLESSVSGQEPLGVSELVLSGFIRVASRGAQAASEHMKIRAFARALHRHPNVLALRPGFEHFELFMRFCELPGVSGNAVPDAYHAALAVETGCTWVTADHGFRRFPELDVRFMP